MNGTYLDREEGQEKTPNFKPDLEMVKAKYRALPDYLKMSFRQQFAQYVMFSTKHPGKMDSFYDFDEVHGGVKKLLANNFLLAYYFCFVS